VVAMPTIRIPISDLLSLVGELIPINKLEELLRLLKCEVSDYDGEYLEVTFMEDRFDLSSTEGLARALAILIGKRDPTPSLELHAPSTHVIVDKTVSQIRPYIGCLIARRETPLSSDEIESLMQVQETLHKTLCRHRRKASIGVYDLAKIQPPIRYESRKREDIRFTPLDWSRQLSADEILKYTKQGQEYGYLLERFDRFPLLLDFRGQVLSMPPIINSEETRVTESTHSLFVDVTGLSRDTIDAILRILAASLAERRFSLEAVKIIYDDRVDVTPDLRPTLTTCSPVDLLSIVGTTADVRVVTEALTRLGHRVFVYEDTLLILTPFYRHDIFDITDIAEDLAIWVGYDALSLKPLSMPYTSGSLLPMTDLIRRFRRAAAQLGFREAHRFTLTSDRVLRQLPGREDLQILEVQNPVSSEFAVARDSLMFSLLDLIGSSKGTPLPIRVFEVGPVIIVDDSEPRGVREEYHAALVQVSSDASYEQVQGALLAILKLLGFNQIRFLPSEAKGLFISGRCAQVLVGDTLIGLLGEVHPQLLERYAIDHPCVAAELYLNALETIRKTNIPQG